MNTDANIKISDTVSLRDALNTSWQLLQLESKATKEAIRERFKDTEDRINETFDESALQKLDAFKKFLKGVALQIDARDILIDRTVNWFNSLEDSFWANALQGEQLKEENRQLRQELESLSLRFVIVEHGLKNALKEKRGQRRGRRERRIAA